MGDDLSQCFGDFIKLRYIIEMLLQDRLPSLLKTAENMRVKGLSESSTHDNPATMNYQNSRYHSNSCENMKYRHLHCDNQLSRKVKIEPFSPLKESSPFIETPKNLHSSTNDKLNRKSPIEPLRNLIAGNKSKFPNNSPKLPNLSLDDKSSHVSAAIVSHQNNGGLVSLTHSSNNFKHNSDSTPISTLSVSGETLKRKRGRPKTLDSDYDVYGQFHDMDEDDNLGKVTSFRLKPWSLDA